MGRPLPLALALLAGLGGCQGVPAGSKQDAGVVEPPPSILGASLCWSRPFGAEGEVPAALIAAGPERLVALTDQALYLLTLEGRVVGRTSLPAAARGPGGVSGLSHDGSGLALALRWRGDARAGPGTYLALADQGGALLEGGMVPLDGPEAQVRSTFDGQAHLAVWVAPGPAVELRQTRAARGSAPSTQVLESGIHPGLALGDVVADPGRLSFCSVEADGRVQLRRHGSQSARLITMSEPDRRGIGPCRLASSGRSQLLAWKNRGVSSDGGPTDAGLKGLRFDEPVARLASPEGVPLGASPLQLTEQSGTMRIEAALWDGARYLLLLDAAGLRGGRLLLAVIDEAGQLLQRDLFLPIEVEPALLLPASLLAGTSDYFVLYGLRHPWDEGILYLARFSLEARAGGEP